MRQPAQGLLRPRLTASPELGHDSGEHGEDTFAWPGTCVPTAVLVSAEGTCPDRPGCLVGESAAAMTRMATEMGAHLPFPGLYAPQLVGCSPNPLLPGNSEQEGGAAPVLGNGVEIIRTGSSTSHFCRHCDGNGARENGQGQLSPLPRTRNGKLTEMETRSTSSQ